MPPAKLDDARSDGYSDIKSGNIGGHHPNGSSGAEQASSIPNDIVRLPIKLSDYPHDSTDVAAHDRLAQKQGLLSKLSHSIGAALDPSHDFKVLLMSRSDFEQYWAKDAQGHFLPGVVEPPGGRREWIQRQEILAKEWKKRDPSLGTVDQRDRPQLGDGFNGAAGEHYNRML